MKEKSYFGQKLTLTQPIVFKDKEEEKRWKSVGKFLKKAFKEVEKRLREMKRKYLGDNL